jgi:hypothetical protein
LQIPDRTISEEVIRSSEANVRDLRLTGSRVKLKAIQC